ncbi:hypothetical protein NIES2130_02785 [Scytonema sp. HK-05]|nr:hypothetical protein NIES2130_02785 [Scytonema sp. HK-05]
MLDAIFGYVKKNAERRTAAREYPHGWNPGDLRMEKFSFSLAFKFGGSHTNTQKPELLTHNEKTRFIF